MIRSKELQPNSNNQNITSDDADDFLKRHEHKFATPVHKRPTPEGYTSRDAEQYFAQTSDEAIEGIRAERRAAEHRASFWEDHERHRDPDSRKALGIRGRPPTKLPARPTQ